MLEERFLYYTNNFVSSFMHESVYWFRMFGWAREREKHTGSKVWWQVWGKKLNELKREHTKKANDTRNAKYWDELNYAYRCIFGCVFFLFGLSKPRRNKTPHTPYTIQSTKKTSTFLKFNYHATCLTWRKKNDEIGAKESVKLDFRHLFMVM